MYKNKLVAEVNKEVEKENEAKALEVKKQKIRLMLSGISNFENNIFEKKKEIENIEKQISELKIALEKEDFSSLNSWLNQPYGSIIGLSVDTGMSCTAALYNPKY